MILLCFRLILIVGPSPDPSYLMISYGFVLFSNGFVMFLVDFNRRPSIVFGYHLISYGSVWFCNGLAMFLVDLNRQYFVIAHGFI